MKLENIKNVFATDKGVTIQTENIELNLGWDIIDKIAEVSEPHYHEEMYKDFKLLIQKVPLNKEQSPRITIKPGVSGTPLME